MTSSSRTLQAFTDAAADRIARSIAGIQREAKREQELRDAQFAARMAELEARIASVSQIERRLEDRLASLKDGMDGRDGADGLSVSAEEVLPALIEAANEAAKQAAAAVLETWDRPENGRDGQSVTVDDVAPMIAAGVAEAVAALPKPENGKDGSDGKDGRDGADVDPDAVRAIVDEAVASIPSPKDGRDGQDADMETIDRWIDEHVQAAVALIPAAKDGHSPTEEEYLPLIDAAVERAVAAIPPPKDGEKGEPGGRGPEGAPGALPVITEWEDRVYY